MQQWFKTPYLGEIKQRNQNSGKVESWHFSHFKGTIDFRISHYLVYFSGRTDMQETYQVSEVGGVQ